MNIDLTTIAAEVDARGLKCPLPILRTKKALVALSSGQILRVLATDSSAQHDFAAFTRHTGHVLLQVNEVSEGEWLFLIQRR